MRINESELKFLGIESSPAFVRAPEGNGSERIIRTHKEQFLWLRPFRTVEELRLTLFEWKDRYNRSWLIERHGFLTPDQARRRYEEMKLAAEYAQLAVSRTGRGKGPALARSRRPSSRSSRRV